MLAITVFILLQQLYINGYSQIVSKYYRNKKNVTYREFYDKLFERIKSDPILFGDHYKNLYNKIYNYMTTGKVVDSTGHALEMSMATDFNLFWEHKEHTFNLIFDCWGVDSRVMNLQKEFVYNPKQDYPIKLSLPFNLDTWEDQETEYNVCNAREESERDNMWLLKRLGLDKNTIVEA